jgi:hypothetical protein
MRTGSSVARVETVREVAGPRPVGRARSARSGFAGAMKRPCRQHASPHACATGIPGRGGRRERRPTRWRYGRNGDCNPRGRQRRHRERTRSRARTEGSFGDPAHGRSAHDGDSGAVAGDHRRQPRPAARRSGGFGEALRALEAPGREPRLPNIGFASREALLDPPVDPRLRGVGNVIDDHGTLGACCVESHSGFVFPAPSVTASQGGESSSSRRPRGVYSSSEDQPSQLSVGPTVNRGWPRVSHLGLEHAYRPSATRPRSRRPRCLMVRGRILAVALGRGAASPTSRPSPLAVGGSRHERLCRLARIPLRGISWCDPPRSGAAAGSASGDRGGAETIRSPTPLAEGRARDRGQCCPQRWRGPAHAGPLRTTEQLGAVRPGRARASCGRARCHS